ncbi:tyrosine-protein phosphatase [Sphingobium estronivorans]|uniref:tyrosine-protein phosphatase n=1 Tax=Sphingobium estronivorans TaxID=1577690 RepID=UPI001239BE32|nr:tyrosine-protein phosphatase [Sphingobium estronivorans]
MRHAPSCIVALALALAGCSTAVDHSAARWDASAARSAAPIPFTAASVEKQADGSYRIAWQMAGAGHVRIFASSDPAAPMTSQPVAQGGATDSATIARLAPDKRWYFTLTPDRGGPLLLTDRALHLSTAPNFRDIGGYRTVDGRWVKPGLIYRSDQLDRLSDGDLAAIGALRPGLLVDLRTETERKREPDRAPPGVRQQILDVAADSSGSLGGDMRKAQAAIASGQGAALLAAANRDFVSLPSARAAYGTLLRELAEGNDGPLIYHCTAGKDRTGWATAVILTLLGVPQETVMADFLASNRYLKAKNDATIAAMKASGAAFDPAFLEPVLTVRPEYLQNAFDEVQRRYGSFDAYARDGLGLSQADIAALRRRYLTAP